MMTSMRSRLPIAGCRWIFNAQRPLNDEDRREKIFRRDRPCNPLKSPDSEEGIQGYESKFKINIGAKRKRISEISSKYKQKLTVIVP
jgi:hypothetical protein